MLPALVTAIPGPRSRACAEKLRRYEGRNITWLADDFPVFWERASGTNVWDVDGNRFLDFTSAFAVTGLGHGAPPLRDALVSQAGRLMHAMGDVHPSAAKAELCEVLSAITFERWGEGPGRTILGNSGSDAVEAALKTALLKTGRPGVISFEGGYHGLGHGALAAAGLPFFRSPFEAQLAPIGERVAYPRSAEELSVAERKIAGLLASGRFGCVLVEPVQGRGGDLPPADALLPVLRSLCDRFDALLVLDEIYTGFHRAGALFACETSGVVPDLICLAKALSGGFPISACVGREAVMQAWPPSQGEALHTSTTLGHPLGCAVALAAIAEHRKPETARRAAECGARIEAVLRALDAPCVAGVRGRGAMWGVELVRPDGSPDGARAGCVMRWGLQDGLILLGGGPHGNILSFSPPFDLSAEEAGFLKDRLDVYLKRAVDSCASAVPLTSCPA